MAGSIFATKPEVVSVLDADPELGEGLRDDDLIEASRAARAYVHLLDPDPAPSLPGEPGDIGLLVLDGFITRAIVVEGRRFIEVLGRGDLLRPWEAGESLVTSETNFTVVEPTRVALLDGRFAAAIAPWPGIWTGLVARTMERSRSLAFHLAACHVRGVEQRLLIVLWHLADRWGRVTPDGVVLALRLTHDTIAEMIGARRPTVTLGLQALKSEGHVDRRGDGRYVLHGSPPEALHSLRAQTAG